MSQSTPSSNKRKHSKFPASASYRWMRCKGSVRLCEKAPPPKETKYAIEGTHGHSCLEHVVKRYGALKTKTGTETLTKELTKKSYQAEMIEHAIRSAETIFKMRPSPSSKLLIESRVSLSHVVKSPSPLFGTLDYAWVELWGELVVADYKYGAGIPVLPYDDEQDEENPQLMYYASGIAKKFDYDFDRIKLAIIQPRVWEKSEDPLSFHITTVKRLRDFEKKVAAAVKEALTPNAKLVAGEWCRFCPAASFCPEISKGQMEKAGIAFDVEDGIEKLPEVQALSAESLPKLLDAADLLDTWISQVRAHAFRIACEGEKIPGRKLVEKRGSRQWDSDAERLAEVGFSDRAFKRQMLSPAQFEKLGPAEKDFVARFTQSVSSGVTLVKKSDKRPEVEATAGAVFDLEGEDD